MRPSNRSVCSLALAALACVAGAVQAAPPDWGTPARSRKADAPAGAVMRTMDVAVEPRSHWSRVPGCARDIAGGAGGVVYVTGCDVVPNSRGASRFYRWNGATFAPLRAPGHGSAVAAHAGNAYAIGGDAMLYSNANDGEWTTRATPGDQPITDVGAGQAGVWVVTAAPSGEGGNAIARAVPCAAGGRLLADEAICGWRAMPGAAVRIAVGATAWVVNAQGQIFEWQDRTGGAWQKHPGCFSDVAVNAQHVYAVSCRRGAGDGHAIYRWNGAGGWVDTLGAGKRVGVDAQGHAWAITDSGEIWRRD